MWPRLALVVGFLAGIVAAALILGGILVFAPESVPSPTPAPTVVPTASPEPSVPPTPTPAPASPSPAPSAAPSGPSLLPSGSPVIGGEGALQPTPGSTGTA